MVCGMQGTDEKKAAEQLRGLRQAGNRREESSGAAARPAAGGEPARRKRRSSCMACGRQGTGEKKAAEQLHGLRQAGNRREESGGAYAWPSAGGEAPEHMYGL